MKTKEKDPTVFRTYDLPESEILELNRELIREINYGNGLTLRIEELDQEMMFQQSAVVLPDEPKQFVD